MPTPEPIPDLLKAANEASGKAFALWITFLTIATYLAIAIGTTTQLQLLLAGPVKLPLLGVDLPLVAFYGFAPPLFVVLHLHVLMQLYLLSRLLSLFNDELQAAHMIEQDRRRIRGQLDKFVFTQFLIGAHQDRIVLLFLRMVVLLSFVVGPTLLLLGFQLRFLPYHSVPVSDVHAVALTLDFMLLLRFWPMISRIGWPEHGLALLWCSFFVLFQPMWPSAHFSNIWLIGERLVESDEVKLSKLSRTLSLRGRDFRQAVLTGTDLRKADLRATDFNGADLSDANLTGADLSVATLIAANLTSANLTGADLSSADLSVATTLIAANLTSANLTGADLSSADLAFANLFKASLARADLIGANLHDANLSDADLSDAKNLTQAQLDQACGKPKALPEGLKLDYRPCSLNPGATP